MILEAAFIASSFVGGAGFGPVAETSWKINQDVECGKELDVYTNGHEKGVVVKVDLAVSCDCGEGALGKAVLSDGGETKNVCEVEGDVSGSRACGFDMPSGTSLDFICNIDNLPAEKRNPKGKCHIGAKLETVVVAPPPEEPTPGE